MGEKILFVDDEKNVLDAIRRQLRKKYRLETALGPRQGLAAVAEKGPFAVVVSDFRMPVMDGLQLLARVREISPDSVRMMLTGNADLQTAINGVNKGHIFHFLTKPCPTTLLCSALDQGIEQYHLLSAQRELLEKTLKGSIELLTDLLSLVNPEAFGRSSRIRQYVSDIAGHLEIADTWQLETAALLSQIGWIALPGEALRKICAGQPLEGEEVKPLEMQPMIAADLLKNIPRMQPVAEIIAFQEKHFDGGGVPDDPRRGIEIPLGARILKVVLDFDLMETRGLNKAQSLDELKKRPGWYDPNVLGALEKVLSGNLRFEIRDVSLEALAPGMTLAGDVKSARGQLLVTRGQEVSPVLCRRLESFAKTTGVLEPIRVSVRV